MITCDSKSLLTALSSCSRLTSKRTTLPMLSCVKLSCKDNILTLEASDLDCFISVNVPSEGVLESLCVPALLMASAVNACEGSVRLETKGTKLLVQDGEMQIAGILPEEFVPTPKLDGKDSGLDCKQVAAGMIAAARCVYKEQDRIHGQFVHIFANRTVACVESTDFKRIHRTSVPSTSECEAMVHHNYSQECIDALQLPGAAITISERYFIIRHNSGFLAVRLGEGEFAATNRVVDALKNHKLIGTASCDSLKKLIRDSIPFTTDRHSCIILDFSKSGVECSLASDIGNYKRSIAGNFEPLLFGVFPKYFLEALMACGDDVEIYGLDHLAPMQIKSGNFMAILCGANVSEVGERVEAREAAARKKT